MVEGQGLKQHQVNWKQNKILLSIIWGKKRLNASLYLYRWSSLWYVTNVKSPSSYFLITYTCIPTNPKVCMGSREAHILKYLLFVFFYDIVFKIKFWNIIFDNWVSTRLHLVHIYFMSVLEMLFERESLSFSRCMWCDYPENDDGRSRRISSRGWGEDGESPYPPDIWDLLTRKRLHLP